MEIELVGVTEIAGMLGVSTQRVSQLSKAAGFPVPVADLAAGRVWHLADIESWARETGRI